jgi:HK97 family phage portal protein
MQNSAVWAAIRLRADMLSTMPIGAWRDVNISGDKIKAESYLSPFMASPKFLEWRYSSQVELDRSGNSIGIITDVDAMNYPANIDLQPSSVCSIVYRDGKLSKYRINGKLYDPAVIWHEKQYTVSGLDMGLSPVMHAAFTLGQYVSVQQFATDWFISGATPRAILKNTAKKISGPESAVVKEAWRASQSADEPFVTGSDWEYSLVAAQEASADWMAAQKMGLEDAARFFGVPADLIDAQMSSPNITYANITQRNLQFLVLNLQAAITRRENAWSQLLPKPRYVEMDTGALLRMDPLTRAQWIAAQIQARTLAPSEARQMDNRQPYTPAQIKEFDELGLNRRGSTPLTSLAPMDLDGNPVAVTVADITAGDPTPEDIEDQNDANSLATEEEPNG